jgi:hypothetical protein
MDKVLLPATYAERLTAYLGGGAIEPLLSLFDEHAVVERYVYGEPPRTYNGIEQIEESLLRLPPTGGSFRITDVHVEEDAVHARFVTQDFPYPLRGLYRFELALDGRIAHLYVAARYHRASHWRDLESPHSAQGNHI